MATKNIVPNADSEGGIGTSSKYWATGFIDAINTTGNLVIGGNARIGSQSFPAFHSNRDVLVIGQKGNLNAIDSSGDIYLNNNIFVNSSGQDIAIAAGGTAQLRLSDSEILIYTGDSPGAGAAATLTSRLTISSTVSTFGNNIKIPDSGTIGCASDTDLLTLADQSLTVAGAIKQSGATSLLTLNDSNSDSSGSTNVFQMTDYENNVLFKIAQISGGLNAEINQVVNGSLAFKTNNTAALTLDSSQNATFAGSITSTGNLQISNDSPDIFFNTTGNHYNWMIGAQENVGAAFEISVDGGTGGASDTTASNYTPVITVKQDQSVIVAGTLNVGNGSASTPGLNFAGNGDAGFYNVGGDNIGFAANGAAVYSMNTSGITFEAGKGLIFNATNTPAQNAGSGTHNTLDDYEEGTWSPVPGKGGTNVTIGSTASQQGTYVKIGRQVTITWDFQVTLTDAGTSGQIVIINSLPFVCGTSSGNNMAGYSVVHFRASDLYDSTVAQRTLSGFVEQGAAYIRVQTEKMGTDGYGGASLSSAGYILNVSKRSTGICTYFTN